jgi:hypothetical protein
MTERDYKSTPVADALGIRGVIDGLATDLQDLRAGKISPVDAMARAHLAKQFFNGARLVLLAMKEIQPPKMPPRDEQLLDAKDRE